MIDKQINSHIRSIIYKLVTLIFTLSADKERLILIHILKLINNFIQKLLYFKTNQEIQFIN